MAKSSIHIQRAVEGSVGHNSREHFSYSVVFVDDGEQNECTHSVENAYKIYRAELKKRTQTYEARTGQKLQKSAVTQLSAIINLEQHHTLKDLKSIKKHLEKTFGTKVYQMAIHRDEGKLISKIDGTELYSGKDFFLNPENKKFYFDKQFTKEIDLKDYEIVKNYHAHIEMMGLDSNGYAIRQKMNKTVLKQMQTFVAKELNMERGKENISYSQDEMKQILAITGKKSVYESNTLFAKRFNEVAKELGIYKEKNKRKDTHIFKDVGAVREEAKREVLKEVLATKEQLKEANNKLRAFMKENQAVRTDYAELEKEKKILEEKLKEKTLTEKELLEKFQELEKNFKITLERKDKYLDNLKEIGKDVATIIPIKELKEIPDAVKTVLTQNKSLEEQKEVLEEKVSSLEEKIVLNANMTAPQPPNDVRKEFELIKKEEIEEKDIKTGLFATEKAKVLKSETNFLQRTWNIVASKYEDLKAKYNDLVNKFKDLQKENETLKEKVKQLESEAPKQQKKTITTPNDLIKQMEAKTESKSDSSLLNEKKLTTREQFEIHREVTREQIKEDLKEKKEEKSNTKKRGFSNSR
ncbi:hypothetical protein ACOTVL_10760 [Aliarcobacter butzleri]